MLQDDFRCRRRYLYLVLFSVVLAGNLVTIILRRHDPPAFAPYMVVALLSLGSLVALWLRPEALRWVEHITCATLLSLNVAALYYDLFVVHNHFGELVYWVVLCYLLAFMVFPPRVSLALCGAFFFVKLAMTLYHVHRFDESFAGFLGFYASQVVAISLYYLLVAVMRKNREEIERLATTDFLTGQLNRRHLFDLIRMEVARARRYQRTFSLLLFDIDNFKVINDTRGHLSGDKVLKGIAALLARSIRPTDRLGRWGGEEFLLLAPETGPVQNQQLAERLRQLIAAASFGQIGGVTASFGGTTYREGDTVETLLKRADDALYAAKQGGRNQVCTAEP